ncbi:MAG: hypothetical protein K8W52_33715 [Deltaproteobacteria bacterium]|nr:hypothetical protein [Deltaproteobacteria bacterium]
MPALDLDVKLEGMWNSVLDNVILDGGDVGVHAVSGSRLELANVQTLSKQRGPSRAILIEGGNAHVLRHCRFEGSPPTNPSNVHITLTGGTSDIAIDAASAEGATELLHLDIDDASMVRVTNPNLGPIRVGRRASRVEILGGSVGGLPPSAILPARPAIHVEAGARHGASPG